jgi:lysophospholipase L1-like esterase
MPRLAIRSLPASACRAQPRCQPSIAAAAGRPRHIHILSPSNSTRRSTISPAAARLPATSTPSSAPAARTCRPSFQLAFANGTPDLLTITAGANDAQWTYFLRYCYTNDCASGAIPFAASQGCVPDKLTSISTTNLANCYLAALQLKLVGAFWAIQHYSGGNPPTTVVTGYYDPLSAACSAKYPAITPAEVAWMHAEVNALNGTISQVAAQYPFVRYAPVDFTGHDVCSDDSWIQGLGSAQPFHPTTRGQQEIAAAVLRQL